ncbi:hypothetical protein [Marinicrinis sediminis]|uniref:Lipoprotein n=1 Tax=Marinicrinis sediminis TaxID=1652465 RepID=A0ABW5R975_9BACL
MNKKKMILLFLFAFILSSCVKQHEQNEVKYFTSKHEALQYGMNEVRGEVIDQWTMENETFIFYKEIDDGGVSVSSISHSSEGYYWFNGIASMICHQCYFQYTSEYQNTIPIIAGKIENPNVKSVEVENAAGHAQTLNVQKGYYIEWNTKLGANYKVTKELQ